MRHEVFQFRAAIRLDNSASVVIRPSDFRSRADGSLRYIKNDGYDACVRNFLAAV
jgi:hypothetical protein